MSRMRRRLLVIDDEAVIRESFQKVFEGEPDRWEVVVAPSGEAGLERLREESFDLVFTDLKMPGMGGLEVLERGRRLRPEADFAMMTGYASVESAVDAMKLGALDYIEKPFGPDELKAFVERLIALREDRIRIAEERRGFLRFTRPVVVQHFVMVVTFTLLALTGVPLFFPETFRGVFFFEDSSYLRGLMHRIAAVALMGLSIYHIGYILYTEDGNRNFRAILPRIPGDLKEAWGNILYTFGLRQEKPRAGQYTFFEKFEYFGVVWGTLVMVLSGLVLWFTDAVLRVAPLWVVDLAKVVHRYEAILAILTIAIWHMYNVHWRPGVFPMSRVWITGRISREEMIEEHPLWYEALTGRPAVADGHQEVRS